jgi:hypothetical protein
MVSEDGTIFGGIFHKLLRARNFPPSVRAIDFESELSDGTFIVTTNTLESARTVPAPGVETEKFPATTDPAALLEVHYRRVGAVQRSHLGASLTILRSMEDVIQFQHRMHRIKANYRMARGYVDASDLEKVRGRELNPHERQIAVEIEKLKENRIKNGT